VLYVAGDIQPAEAQKIADRYFGDWRVEGEKPAIKLAFIPEPSTTQIYLVDRPGSVQSQIRVGLLGITRNDPDYFPTVVLSQIFGGSFSSRLNKAIRVEKGLTYGARGGWSAQRFAGSMTISTFTKNPSTAETLNVILGEVQRMKAAAPETEEVDTARSYLVGSFAGNRETPGAIVGDLWLIEYAGLPKDYLARFLTGVKNTTPESVHRVAKRLIDENRLSIVVVGEASAVQADLEKIAPVTVIRPPTDQSQEPAAQSKPPT
jgi:zinc protease